MRAEASVSGQSRPPTTTVAGQAGASLSRSVRLRPTLPARLVEVGESFHPSDPYVRRFWVAAIGPSAVAELLRLVRVASMDEDVRLPRHLPLFLRLGLVWVSDGQLMVPDSFPEVPRELRWRFPPALIAEHGRALGGPRQR